MATLTSTSCVKRFLVAEAIAISSAANTVSRLTFFSRASASTSSKISRLIFLLSYLCLQVRNEPGPFHTFEFKRNPCAFHFHRQSRAFHALQHAYKPLPAVR